MAGIRLLDRDEEEKKEAGWHQCAGCLGWFSSRESMRVHAHKCWRIAEGGNGHLSGEDRMAIAAYAISNPDARAEDVAERFGISKRAATRWMGAKLQVRA